MENTTVSKNSVSFGLALAIAALVNAIIVVAKESSKDVMSDMGKVTGHHWVTHTLIVFAVFGISAFIFGKANKGQGTVITTGKLIATVLSGVVLAGLIIVGFYLVAD